jgi:hypothetical protein
VLDHVERRRFFVDPAGKDPVELALWVTHVHLHEGARQLLHFPRRALLAGAKADDDVAGADRLAWAELEFPRDTVALVEQAKHRNPLRHRRRAGRHGRHRLRDVDRLRLGLGLAVPTAARALAAAALAAGSEGEEQRAGGSAKAGAAHP